MSFVTLEHSLSSLCSRLSFQWFSYYIIWPDILRHFLLSICQVIHEMSFLAFSLWNAFKEQYYIYQSPQSMTSSYSLLNFWSEHCAVSSNTDSEFHHSKLEVIRLKVYPCNMRKKTKNVFPTYQKWEFFLWTSVLGEELHECMWHVCMWQVYVTTPYKNFTSSCMICSHYPWTIAATVAYTFSTSAFLLSMKRRFTFNLVTNCLSHYFSLPALVLWTELNRLTIVGVSNWNFPIHFEELY